MQHYRVLMCYRAHINSASARCVLAFGHNRNVFFRKLDISVTVFFSVSFLCQLPKNMNKINTSLTKCHIFKMPAFQINEEMEEKCAVLNRRDFTILLFFNIFRQD